MEIASVLESNVSRRKRLESECYESAVSVLGERFCASREKCIPSILSYEDALVILMTKNKTFHAILAILVNCWREKERKKFQSRNAHLGLTCIKCNSLVYNSQNMQALTYRTTETSHLRICLFTFSLDFRINAIIALMLDSSPLMIHLVLLAYS
ncbi:hypothetical protein LOAG_10300 [Loa loa]|uniref:Uncharacterized protein n=1 Tax=Loa loa TaxID=7209 RepID=A0A1S0TQ46_LOALO|nr:hypothetical protein LOAG_10300 [Loa loa]EFO18195.1 hypothetical protein LOAG_10300 [Loa loa]